MYAVKSVTEFSCDVCSEKAKRSKRCHQETKPPSRPMTPGEQIALMKVIETLDACENQDPTPRDLTVSYVVIMRCELSCYWFSRDERV